MALRGRVETDCLVEEWNATASLIAINTHSRVGKSLTNSLHMHNSTSQTANIHKINMHTLFAIIYQVHG